MKSSDRKTGKAGGANNTLRRRLLLFILGPLLVSLLIAGSVSFFIAREEIAETYDRQLELLAHVLHSLAVQADSDDDDERITRYSAILGDLEENSFFYRIWIDGKLVLTSPNAAKFKPGRRLPGFSDQQFGNEVWRVYIFQDEDNRITVEAAGRKSLRSDTIREILLFMFIPLLLAVPLIAVLVWFGVIRGLAPISTLSDLIKSRDPYALAPLTEKDIPDASLPDEIRPLVAALNDLMRRMEEVLKTEKMFTDHAAHELRTPLAAIKVQAQVALRTAEGPQRQRMLEDLVSGVDRASHLVSQLLSLARAQSGRPEFTRMRLDLVIEKVREEFHDKMQKRRLSVKTSIQPQILVSGVEDLIFILFRNLFDNAVKYTPEKGIVHVTLREHQGNSVFCIRNSGPGIPLPEQDHVFEQFYRVPGNESTGCGLGLALVSQICSIHGAKTSLQSPDESGLTCFCVEFPGIKT